MAPITVWLICLVWNIVDIVKNNKLESEKSMRSWWQLLLTIIYMIVFLAIYFPPILGIGCWDLQRWMINRRQNKKTVFHFSSSDRSIFCWSHARIVVRIAPPRINIRTIKCTNWTAGVSHWIREFTTANNSRSSQMSCFFLKAAAPHTIKHPKPEPISEAISILQWRKHRAFSFPAIAIIPCPAIGNKSAAMVK